MLETSDIGTQGSDFGELNPLECGLRKGKELSHTEHTKIIEKSLEFTTRTLSRSSRGNVHFVFSDFHPPCEMLLGPLFRRGVYVTKSPSSAQFAASVASSEAPRQARDKPHGWLGTSGCET
jgi:hypothetical protein